MRLNLIPGTVTSVCAGGIEVILAFKDYFAELQLQSSGESISGNMNLKDVGGLPSCSDFGAGPHEQTSVAFRLDRVGRGSLQVSRSPWSLSPVLLRIAKDRVIVSDSYHFARSSKVLSLSDLNRDAVVSHLLTGASPIHSLISGWELVPPNTIYEAELGVSLRFNSRPFLSVTHGTKLHLEDVQEEWAEVFFREPLKLEALLFTGGVDSSILATGLDYSSLVFSGIDSEEHHPERVLAQSVATLIARPLREFQTSEADYSEMLVRATTSGGLPVVALWNPLIMPIFESGYRSLGSAYAADAIYGLRASRAVHNRTPLPASPEPALVASHLFRNHLAKESENVIPRELISDFHRIRGDFVKARLGFSDSPPLHHQALVYGHTIHTIWDTTPGFLRSVGASFGAKVWYPFVNQNATTLFSEVAIGERYLSESSLKPLLTDVLRTRIPAYPFPKDKLASGLPRTRFLSRGPLSNLKRKFFSWEEWDCFLGLGEAVDPEVTWENSWFFETATSLGVWLGEGGNPANAWLAPRLKVLVDEHGSFRLLDSSG